MKAFLLALTVAVISSQAFAGVKRIIYLTNEMKNIQCNDLVKEVTCRFDAILEMDGREEKITLTGDAAVNLMSAIIAAGAKTYPARQGRSARGTVTCTAPIFVGQADIVDLTGCKVR